MCGVAVHSAESYLGADQGGNRVAIAEQTESPAEARKARGSKALVERAIVRLVTPGTLTEERLLQSSSANWLAAVGRAGDEWAIAAADISTGRFELVSCGAGELAAELARLSPARPSPNRPCRACARRRGKAGSTALPGSARSEPVRPGDPRWPRPPSRAELAAAGGLLAYLDATQKGAGILLDAPRRIAARATWRSTPRPATASSSRVRSAEASPEAWSAKSTDARAPPAGDCCSKNLRPAHQSKRDRAAARPRRLVARRGDPPRARSPGAKGIAGPRAGPCAACGRTRFPARSRSLARRPRRRCRASRRAGDRDRASKAPR